MKSVLPIDKEQVQTSIISEEYGYVKLSFDTSKIMSKCAIRKANQKYVRAKIIEPSSRKGIDTVSAVVKKCFHLKCYSNFEESLRYKPNKQITAKTGYLGNTSH